jgi:hypothetical protein
MHRKDGNKMNKQKRWERNMEERREGDMGMRRWKNRDEGTGSKVKEKENIGGEEL